MITEEQLAALLGMGDIGGAESDMANQMALADKLRQTYANVRGKDVGSNIARAAGGIGGALGAYKGQGMQPGITGMKRSLLAEMMRKRSGMGGGEIYGDEGE